MTTVKQTGRRSAPTLEEVAAAAGVSRSTVSRVVNGSSQVSEDVLAAVQDAIELLNYVPNRAARSLANSQTMAIALVVPEDTSRFFGDPYFSAVVQGIANGLEDSDYVLNLQLAHPSRPSPKTTRYLLGGNVDGAFVISHHVGDDFLTTLSATLPVVFGGRPLDPTATQSYYVDVDNVTAATVGVQRLIDLNRTRIGMIAGPTDMPAGIDRTTGWKKALADAGLPADRIANGDFSLMSGARAMRELLEAYPDTDGVFVASDLMAAGALGVLAERRIAVPADIAVVGFDDSPAAVAGPIQLTTVHQPSYEMGEKMAEVMLGLLRGENVDRVHLLETRLVIRDSA
ncbi:LacI family DNA-binding transcriptional regulator [Parafrigoribacterium humi]|jgi:LacI family transcriptional regulator|uniref:LacI family DNA-binding transcriptional regulator n=1 Tax=Parafrigoribacterium humi TaxID=3144664 RepID=UPI0032EBAD41